MDTKSPPENGTSPYSEFFIESIFEAWIFFAVNLIQRIFEKKLDRKQIPWLPSIGPGSMQLLKDHGFNTALDLQKAGLFGISVPTFGPAKKAILDAWFRNEKAACDLEIKNTEKELFELLNIFRRHLNDTVALHRKNDNSKPEQIAVEVPRSLIISILRTLLYDSSKIAVANGFEFPSEKDFLNKCNSLSIAKYDLKSKRARERDDQNIKFLAYLIAGVAVIVIFIMLAVSS